MKHLILICIATITTVFALAQEDSTVVKTKSATITVYEDDGSSYTIEIPDIEQLGDLRDLENLEELEDIDFEEYDVTIVPDTSFSDSTSVSIGDWKIVIREKENSDDIDIDFGRNRKVVYSDYRDVDVFQTEPLLMSIGYNTFMDANKNISVPAPYQDMESLNFWGSTDLNLDLFRSRVNMFHGYLNFNFGTALEWHHFRFTKDFTLSNPNDTLMLTKEDINYDKNKFNTMHIAVPLYIGTESKPWDTDNSFHFMVGYSPGLRVKTKTKHKLDGSKEVYKEDFNVQTFRHEVNAVIGYGKFNLYASYDLNPLFIEGRGPEIHPFSVGIIVRRGF
ncbi:MAG: hypothetical protein KBF51_03370 [Chitinophagales bacterium]|nr:hypothetical protein [Bacteroidota bacterium]MBP9188553.1 hypothetical protein [Chitinophagales bacterium]MBP9704363.1 hypothetical protein [Chitinophagales bacterium]